MNQMEKTIKKGCYIRFQKDNEMIYGTVLSVIKDDYKIEYQNQKGESVVEKKKREDLILIGNYN